MKFKEQSFLLGDKQQPKRAPQLSSLLRWTICASIALASFVADAAQPTAAILENLSLVQAISIAAEYNHDIRLSGLAKESAEAATIIANAPPNPTLTLQTANINPQLGIGPGPLRNKTFETTIRIDQVIERGGKRELRTENAQDLEQAAQSDLDDAGRQLRLNVGQAYYELMAAQERLRAARETVALFDATVAAAEKRQQAGDLAGADVERIRVDVLRSRNDAKQAEDDLAKARLALAQLMGIRSSSNVIHAADRWPAIRETPPPRTLETMIEKRPDVRAAQARVDATIAARKLALASRTRDVSVGLQFDHYPSSAANPQGSGNSYGFAVQIPLFVHYDYEGEIRAAETAVDAAQENLEKVRDTARTEMFESLHDLRTAADRARRFQGELLIAAKKSASAAEFAFRNGAASVMDVLDARRTYRSTQLDAIAALADYAKSLAAWRAAAPDESEK